MARLPVKKSASSIEPMSKLILLGLLIAAIAWPSRLVSRLAPQSGYGRFGFFMLGPAAALAGGTCASYLLFPLLAAAPSSPKEYETMLVSQGLLGLLVACIGPWVVYFALKVCRNGRRPESGTTGVG